MIAMNMHQHINYVSKIKMLSIQTYYKRRHHVGTVEAVGGVEPIALTASQ
jgi:hypothetical protein